MTSRRNNIYDRLRPTLALRKIVTVGAALLLGAFGGGMSTIAITAVLAAAAGVQVLWSIWDRAHADGRSGNDPGPSLAVAQRH